MSSSALSAWLVHPTSLCIRCPLAVALGGWMAVPSSEDTGLLIAASVLTTGWFTESYRKLGSLPASPQVSGVMARVSDKTHGGADGHCR